MKSTLLAASLAALSGVAVPHVCAQNFALLEHRYVVAEPDLWSEARTDEARKPIAPPRSSYREALYEPLIRRAEARYRLPPKLLKALVWAESRFDPMAISPVGAAGLSQLMPATARELGVLNRHDPAENIDGGARYLRQMLDRFGDIHLALAAYNAGPGAVSRAGGIPRNKETPAYVRSVLRRWLAYSSS